MQNIYLLDILMNIDLYEVALEIRIMTMDK